LLNLATELGNVSRACKVMGLPRDTFYRYQSAVESGGVDAPINANRRKPNPKNRVEEATEPSFVIHPELIIISFLASNDMKHIMVPSSSELLSIIFPSATQPKTK
jgi:hypothetical protein